ncbi:hypothetical protein BDR06DRAFT_968050 [Suillus hirtellus]|nr:hypothetical protein BDR06DRAFT_968050 [Suillus hirtellus]
MEKLKLKEFQLSQLSIENADLPVDDCLVNFFARDLSSDGGQWDMVVDLLETCGLVPQPIYPESYHSNASSPINTLLKSKLREHTLRALFSSLKADHSVSPEPVLSTLRAKKEELMYKIYTIMSASLGVPPKPDAAFTWETSSEDDFIDAKLGKVTADGKLSDWAL